MPNSFVPSLENLALRYSFEGHVFHRNETHFTGREKMAADSSRSGSGYGSVAEPCTVILFGASGDLAKRKVIPALYDLAIHDALGPRYALVGFARTPMTDESFRATASEAQKVFPRLAPSIPNSGTDSLPISFTVPVTITIRKLTPSSPSASQK